MSWMYRLMYTYETGLTQLFIFLGHQQNWYHCKEEIFFYYSSFSHNFNSRVSHFSFNKKDHNSIGWRRYIAVIWRFLLKQLQKLVCLANVRQIIAKSAQISALSIISLYQTVHLAQKVTILSGSIHCGRIQPS